MLNQAVVSGSSTSTKAIKTKLQNEKIRRDWQKINWKSRRSRATNISAGEFNIGYKYVQKKI